MTSERAESPSKSGIPPLMKSAFEIEDRTMGNPYAETFAGSIIVGASGLHDSDNAIRWAGEQARLENRPLFALMAGKSFSQAAVRVALDQSSPVPIEPVPGHGDPAKNLIALSQWAHMIVVGSHGRGPMGTLLLGSVGATVSRGARCPVVICRPRGWSDGGHGVVVAVDGTAGSRDVVEFAFRQASLRGMPLTVLHCFCDPVTIVTSDRSHRRVDLARDDVAELRLMLDNTIAGFESDYPDVNVTVHLEAGWVDDVLGRDAIGWDLIVVGHRPQGRIDRILVGSRSAAILERAHSVVAIVPETPLVADEAILEEWLPSSF